MAFEISLKFLFQDFNQSKFVVYLCLLIFTLLLALRMDGVIDCSYWLVFLPIWLWKALVLAGALVGSCVWCRSGTAARQDTVVAFRAMVLTTGLHMLLLTFEMLACYKLEVEAPRLLWVLVLSPLIFMAVVSIGVCVWAVKHERGLELELVASVNCLQFILLGLRLDGVILWSWASVLIPLWLVMCVAVVGVIYLVILALILLKSPDLVPEQRRKNVYSAVGSTCLVLPLLVFLVLLVYREDGLRHFSYVSITLPLHASFFTLMLMSFGAKPANPWWFGLRKEFCPWLLGACPCLQEYGNISYKSAARQEPSPAAGIEAGPGEEPEPAPGPSHAPPREKRKGKSKRRSSIEERTMNVKVLTLEIPD